MVDKSWGVGATSDVRIRSNERPDDRAAARAAGREERARARADTMAARLEARAAGREADTAAREAARIARREQEQQRASGDPHADAARRHRSSGRKDIVREQRDTRGYTTVVDAGRIRELARRGASITGLAGAFGISEAEVERALADAE
jgi:hypothetical protein